MRMYFMLMGVVVITVLFAGCGDFIKEALDDYNTASELPDFRIVQYGTVTVYYTEDIVPSVAKRFAEQYQEYFDVYHDVDIDLERTHDNKYKVTLFVSSKTEGGTVNIANSTEAQDIAKMLKDDVVVIYRKPNYDFIDSATSDS